MKQIKIKTWLPVFPGFYNTIFEPDEDSEIEDVNGQREAKGLKPIDFDDFEFNYDEYRSNTCKAGTNFIDSELSHVFKSKISIEFEKMHSPREYNFHNDGIDVVIIVTNAFLKELKRYLRDNYEAFDKYISDRYTSRSGFSSFHSSNCDVWLMQYFNDLKKHGHYLGSLLEFVCINEDITQEDMHGYTCGEAYLSATNYNELLTK